MDGEGTRYALVNGSVVKEGELLEGVLVKSIKDYSIVVSHGTVIKEIVLLSDIQEKE